MAGELLMCDACNKQLMDENDLNNHYKSQWHRYNLKRKIAGVQVVTEAVYLARKSTRAEEKRKLQKGLAMSYTCGLCNKRYRSSKAYDHHLKSRSHTSRLSRDYDYDQNKSIPIVKPILGNRVVIEDEHDDDDDDDNLDDDDDVDPTCCFMCDKEHKTIEKCMAHMHKSHGLFIPDVEYLKDPAGLLTYLGHKVKRDFACLYCNINCHPFDSLEAVRKHMVAKSHCKLHYGDDSEEEEAELVDFYDYESSYITDGGKQLVTTDDNSRSIKLGIGGSELIITRATDNGTSIKAIGSREYFRYYRQKPRPSQNTVFTAAMLAARYRTISLSSVQSSEKMVDMKVLKKMNRSGAELMQCKLSMRSNNVMKCNMIRNQKFI